MIIPWVGNVIYLTGIIPIIDITPFVFTTVGILLGWAVLRIELFNLSIAYQVAMSSMSDGIILIDDNHKVLELNPTMASLINLPLEELAGQPISDIFTTALPLGTEQSMMYIDIVNNDNIKKQLQLRISPILNENQTLLGYVIVAHDVTEQKQTEDSMRTLLQQIELIKKEWETTADSLDQLICLLDENGVVMRANLALEKLGVRGS